MRKISMKRKSKADLNSTPSIDEDVDNSEENGQDSSQENNNHSKKKGKKSKKGRKSNNAAESNGTEDKSDVDEEQYEVETVLDQRTVKGVKQFLIRWKGYGSESDTWEPESTLNCQDLIDKFLSSQKTPMKGKKRSSLAANSKPKSKKTKSGDSEDEDDEPSKKSPKKGKRDEGGEPGGEYEVDRIIEVHHKKNGQREFLVHWKGYTANENTWEPEENMNCPDLIERFMAKVAKAKESNTRELRVARKPTEHFTLSMEQIGRRLSRRNLGKQRAQYKETE